MTNRIPTPAQNFSLPGHAPALVFVHGFAGSIADLRPIAEALHARGGNAVYGVRLAGHGRTSLDLHRSTVDDWMASVRSVIDAAAKDGPVVMVGESMGALLALRAARQDPRVAGLILLAPPFKIRRDRFKRISSAFLPRQTRIRKKWVKPHMVAAHQAKGSLLELTVGAYRRFIHLTDQERMRLVDVKQPILAFFAEQDYQTDPQSADVLQQRLDQRQLEVRFFPDAVHHLVDVPDTERLLQPMSTFLKRFSDS